jgi:hypothetical protein
MPRRAAPKKKEVQQQTVVKPIKKAPAKKAARRITKIKAQSL